MAEQSRATKMLEGALDWVKRLPSTMSADVAVDVGRKRVRLSHARAEALTRQVLQQVKHLELTAWSSGPALYDVRISIKGWRLRVETTLERVELASGRDQLGVRDRPIVERQLRGDGRSGRGGSPGVWIQFRHGNWRT